MSIFSRLHPSEKPGGCMPFISNIGEIMKKKDMTYEELQFRSKVAPDTVARARDERIATCKLFTLEKLANALDVDVCDLFKHVREE
jgi:DNA-binding Xre family transcriptional regulator